MGLITCTKCKKIYDYEKYGLTYVPFQDIFDEWAKKVAPSYLIWDNVHPTMAGHRLMADRWLETVEF